MKHSLNIYLELLKKGREKRHRMISILLVLSFVVTGAVAWNLRLNGVTATVEAFCGYEEHTHTESCTLEEVLACDGTTGHVHSVADCFAFENVLSCVSEEHVHGEECYNAEGESICFKSVHTHSDACYTKEAVLVCEIAEGEHVHTEACYKEKWSCGFVEHVHAAECFADTEADLETADVWEATLPELSGYWAEDTASIALSQVGYAESDVNFILGDNNEKKYYSRYGQWFGHEYGDWNVMFAEFCLYYAGVTDDYIPMSAGANSWQIKLEKQPYYFTNETKAEGYVPAVGSIIFIDLNADGAADKVAVNTGVADGFYSTVEGDLNGVVGETMYAVDSELVIGYLDTTLVAAAYGEGAVSEEVLAEESVQTFLSDFSADTTVNFKYMSYLEKYDFIEDDIEGTYILSGIIDTTAANNGGSPKLPTNAAARAGDLKTLALPLRQVRTAGLFTNNDITSSDTTPENFYYYELGTKIELDELYNGTNDVHLWSGTSVSTNDKLGTNDSYDLTAIWVQKTKDLKLPSESATTDATSKNWKDWTVYCLDEYYQETDVQISLVNVAEGKPVKIESADGSSFSAITYLTAGPDYVLQPVTSVTVGKDYVFVNKKTGKVLTNTVESGNHWYQSLGEKEHVLLGDAPTVDSDKWSFATFDDGYAIVHPDGSYLTPYTVSAGLQSTYTWITPLHVDYNATEKAFQIYRYTSGGVKCKLVACNDLNGNYVYAIGCGDSSDFDAYSYWEIYETVKSTHTAVEAVSTHNQTAVISYLDKYGVLTNGFSSVDYEKPAFNSGDNGVNGKFDCIKVGGGSEVTASLGENRIYYTVDLIDTYEKISYFTFDVAVDTATAKTTGEGFMLHDVEVYDENGWTKVSFYQDNVGSEVYKRDAEYVKCRYTYSLPEIKSARYVRFTVGDNSESGASNGGVAVGEIKVYSTEQNRVNYALNTAKISVKSGSNPLITGTKFDGSSGEIGSLSMKKGGSYERALMIDAPFLFDGYTALNTATANAHEVLQKHRALTLSDSGNVTIEIDLTQEAKKITELVLYSTMPLTVSTVQSLAGWDSNTNLFSSTSASAAKTENFKSTKRELWDGVATRYVYFIDFTSPIESAAILRVTFENKEVTLSEIKVYGEPSNELNYALGRYVYMYNTGVVNSTSFKGDSTEPFTAYGGAYFGIRYDNADNTSWRTRFRAAHTFHTTNYVLTNGVETGDSVSFALKNSDALDGAFCTTSNAVNFQGAFNKNRMVFVVDLDGKKNGITEVSFFVNHKDDSDYEFNIRSVQAGMDPDKNFVRGWINGTAESKYSSLLSNLEWSDVANGQIKVEDVTGTWKRITYSFTSTEAEYIRIEAYSPKYIQVGEIEVIGSPWVNAAANKSVDISFTKDDLVTPQPVNITARKAEGTTWTDTKENATEYSVAGIGTPGEFDLEKNVLTDGRVPLFGLDDTLLISSATANNKATFKIDLGQVRNVAQVEVYTNDEDVSKWNASGNFEYEKIEVSIDGQNWEEAKILRDGSEAQGGNYSNYDTTHYGMCYVTRQYAELTEDYEARYIKITGKIDNDSPFVSGSTTEYRCQVQEIKVNCLPIYENNIAGYYNGREGHVIPVDTINDLKSIEFLGDGSQFEYEKGSDTNVAPIYDSRTGKVDKVYVGDGYTVIYIYTPLKGTYITDGDMYDYRISSTEWSKDVNTAYTLSTLGATDGQLMPIKDGKPSKLFLQTAIVNPDGTWKGVYGINANYNYFSVTGTTIPQADNSYNNAGTKLNAAPASSSTAYKARVHFGNENNSISAKDTNEGLAWIKWQDGNNTVLPNLANTKLMSSSTNYYQQAAFGIAAETLNYTIDGEYQFEFDSAFDSINLFNGMYGKTSTELATARNSGNPAGATMGKIAYDYDMTYVRNGDKLTLSSVTGTDMYSNGKYSGLPGGSNGSASGKDKLQYLSYVHYKQKTDTFAATPTNNFFPMDNVYFLDRMLNSTSVKGRTDADGMYILSSFGKLQTDKGVIATERKTGQKGKDTIGEASYATFYKGNKTGTYEMVANDDDFAHNSFFGMHDELKFTIPEDYCGPLEFFFYGDDDMWVYLDGQLICDIGGVHSSIAEYVNLWDYIGMDSASSLARATGSEEHTLSIFYTERGAYGSTCYVSFTLPVGSTAPRAIGVSKEAVRINNSVVEDVYDDDFTFNVSFYDAEKNLISEIPTDAELSYIKTLVNGETQVVKLNSLTDDILLKSGESFIMQNLPESFVFFSVEETGASGSRVKGSDGSYVESADNHINYYTTSIEATGGTVSSDGRMVTYVPIDEYNLATARFTNIPALSELPETGGGGIMWFMLIGFALTVIPMGAGIFSTVKKAKRFLAK